MYNRIFLEEFTKELILNSAPAYVKEKIYEQQIKQREFEKQIEEELGEKEIERKEIEPIFVTKTIPRPVAEDVQLEEVEEIIPEEGLYFSRIEKMISDQKVLSIECPGPGKTVIVRTIAKTIPTRIMLNQDEINSIIESFSRESRIPRVGGVFKAIVNNLIITAIDSNFGGPRFIISKIYPQQSRFL